MLKINKIIRLLRKTRQQSRIKKKEGVLLVVLAKWMCETQGLKVHSKP